MSRCALHYGCIKAGTDGPEIYHKLRHALVYESDGITKTLDLSYGYRTIKSSNERATFHLEDKNGVLRLFVPKDKAQREKCYLTQLPKAILRYLFFDDIPEASCFLLLILHASTDVLDEILEEEGIAKFPDSDMVAFEQAKTSEDFLGEGDCLLIEGADGPSH